MRHGYFVQKSVLGTGLLISSALLASCGGSQPPIGAPGAMPQASALVAPTTNTSYKIVYNFNGPSAGENPYARLIEVRGRLYGTTDNGGSCRSYNLCGTVFSLRPGGIEKVLHMFGGVDGYNPRAGLIDVERTLYGTTSGGGSYGTCRLLSGGYYYPCGTVFSITASGKEKVLHSFGNKKDGLNPVASLIDVNGTLYGTTENSGAHDKCEGGCGTVFSLTPSGTEKVLHRFVAGSDGYWPVASLIDVNGTLYGTTELGGSGNCHYSFIHATGWNGLQHYDRR